MTSNDEARMTNAEGNPNAQMTKELLNAPLFEFSHFFVIRHWSFVIFQHD